MKLRLMTATFAGLLSLSAMAIVGLPTAVFVGSTIAQAGETTQTMVFAVENMTCVTCAPTVKKSLSRVPGVTAVEVSAKTHTATVTYDDAKTSTAALIAATTNAGYPSRVRK